MDNASKEGKEIILLGDSNKNLLPDNSDREWLNLALSLGLTQLISEPTRVTNSTKTLIDHINSSIQENISRVSVSKHYAIFRNRKLTSFAHKHFHYTIKYRSFKTFDDNAFKHDLSQVAWEILSTLDGIDEMVQVWNSLFLEIVNKHAPLKEHRVRKPQQPDWLKPDILGATKESNKCKINGNHNEYILLRNKVSSMIRLAKDNVYKTKIEEGKDDPRTMWKIFREFGVSSKAGVKENILGLKDNDRFSSDDGDIAN